MWSHLPFIFGVEVAHRGIPLPKKKGGGGRGVSTYQAPDAGHRDLHRRHLQADPMGFGLSQKNKIYCCLRADTMLAFTRTVRGAGVAELARCMAPLSAGAPVSGAAGEPCVSGSPSHQTSTREEFGTNYRRLRPHRLTLGARVASRRYLAALWGCTPGSDPADSGERRHKTAAFPPSPFLSSSPPPSASTTPAWRNPIHRQGAPLGSHQ